MPAVVHKLHCPIMRCVDIVQRCCSLTLITTCPFSLSISPNRADIKEDLPAPTGPTTATSCPGLTDKSILIENK